MAAHIKEDEIDALLRVADRRVSTRAVSGTDVCGVALGKGTQGLGRAYAPALAQKAKDQELFRYLVDVDRRRAARNEAEKRERQLRRRTPHDVAMEHHRAAEEADARRAARFEQLRLDNARRHAEEAHAAEMRRKEEEEEQEALRIAMRDAREHARQLKHERQCDLEHERAERRAAEKAELEAQQAAREARLAANARRTRQLKEMADSAHAEAARAVRELRDRQRAEALEKQARVRAKLQERQEQEAELRRQHRDEIHQLRSQHRSRLDQVDAQRSEYLSECRSVAKTPVPAKEAIEQTRAASVARVRERIQRARTEMAMYDDD